MSLVKMKEQPKKVKNIEAELWGIYDNVPNPKDKQTTNFKTIDGSEKTWNNNKINMIPHFLTHIGEA